MSDLAVTRTTPVGNGGRFTKEAREIYTLVLKMQNVRALGSLVWFRISLVINMCRRQLKSFGLVSIGMTFNTNAT